MSRVMCTTVRLIVGTLLLLLHPSALMAQSKSLDSATQAKINAIIEETRKRNAEEDAKCNADMADLPKKAADASATVHQETDHLIARGEVAEDSLLLDA